MQVNNFLFNLFNELNSDSIDLFGYKLHSDDLLIIALLFCLYKENVDDQFLFFILILLLFS